MSKVVIQGNASGTGNFTIAAPNSNTDRTFNLPDASGTVATTADIPSLDGISGAYTSGTALDVDSSGRVTTPNQPSFNAHANSNLNHGTSTTKYVWNLTRHNIGSHYDTSNGRFTAPIDGRYYFNIEALQQVDANSYYTRCYLYKNGSQYLDGLNTQALQSGYSRLHLNAVVEASAGDYFETYFVSNNSSAFVYATYSWFSGHLLG